MAGEEDSGQTPAPAGQFLSTLFIFTRLGLTSFGGPIAHLGYFREEFVVRRRWLGDGAFTDLVALCQFLPGPASSQVGFAIGAMHGGVRGGLAAFLGFTWPSAVVMTLFAIGAARLGGPVATGILHGLMLVAVAVVAQAVFGMARTMCRDAWHATIAVIAIAIIAAGGNAAAQVAAILLGAAGGLLLARRTESGAADDDGERLIAPISATTGAVLLGLVPFVLLIFWAAETYGVGGHLVALFSAFYRAGALVFGGGHVVLPLLNEAIVGKGWVSAQTFLTGYGAAQAIPGPLFTFAAFLGAADPGGRWTGALIGIAGIFLPGLTLVLAALPFWDRLRRIPLARAAMAGINAAVVGVLAAALYDPVWTAAVHGIRDFSVVTAAFLLLVAWRVQPWIVVALAAAAGLVLTTI